ncbi:MAG TPA: ATP-binding protein [Hyphomicrobiaceae bacterium]|nr:ATP-binding protein [Hyphomicrobiaceae bacterium]
MTVASAEQRPDRPIGDGAQEQTALRQLWAGRSGGLAGWLWYGRTIQSQLLATVILINLATGLVAGAIVVYNAHDATEVEVAASMEVAEQVVRRAADQLAQEAIRLTPPEQLVERALEALPQRLRHLRHVRISIADVHGHQLAVHPPDQVVRVGAAAPAPAWFGALVRLDTVRRQVPVAVAGRHLATVFLTSQPADELAEVWKDVSGLAVVMLIANLAVIGLFYLALGRVLNPLTSVAAGLRALEQGRFSHRLARPRVRDLADIVDRYNALAGALQTARADNAQLNRRLVTVQDDERREIATELHDELGACLFGLRANVLSVQRLAEQLPAAVGDQMRKRAETLATVSERIQTTNRRLLRRLRPMALGHAPLADVIADLVADFERNDADHAFKLDIGNLGQSYGDCIDLTVYRCIQEGITNAVRHAAAKTVAVRIEEMTMPVVDAPSSSVVLRFSVRDDGHGVAPGAPPGLGLTGMERRVGALGGAFSIADEPGRGTRLDIAIPLQEAEARIPVAMDMQDEDGRG